jgi:uncharacterized membrane protein YeaQ/YmgE (transglycosylase-associated protein family)
MRRSQGVAMLCAIGVAGMLGSGWLATRLFHVHTLPGLASLSTWLTAIGGAAALLVASHLISGRTGRSVAHR